jgi:hypothetical protein
MLSFRAPILIWRKKKEDIKVNAYDGSIKFFSNDPHRK